MFHKVLYKNNAVCVIIMYITQLSCNATCIVTFYIVTQLNVECAFSSKVAEFVGLREHLSHSLNFACVMLDMNIMDFLCSINRSVSEYSIPSGDFNFKDSYLLF